MMSRARLVGIILVIVVLWAGVGFALSGGVSVSGDVTLTDESGLEVTVVNADGELALNGPSAGPDTITVNHSSGDIAVSGNSSMRVYPDGGAFGTGGIEGQTTTIGWDGQTNEITANPADKPAVTVSGGSDSNFDQITWRAPSIDDGTADFEVSLLNEIGTEDSIVTMRGLPAGETVVAWDSNRGVGDFDTVDQSGAATFSVRDGYWQLQSTSAAEIEPGTASPSNNELVTGSSFTLSVNVSDDDFGRDHGDELTATFVNEETGATIGNDTLTGNGTASVSYDSPISGPNSWSVVVTDEFGNEVESETFQFRTPATLEIRDLVSKELITETDNGTAISVEVEFFGDEGSVNRRNTTTGTIDMKGLPANQRFSVSVDAGDGYYRRQIIVAGLAQQQTAYLLPVDDNITTVESRFRLEDPSNRFDSESSEIILERPIDTGNGTEFVPVAGDRIGLNGFTTTLERDQRYRVTVRNPETGDQRRLGEFTPTATEPVTLTVQDVEFDSVSDVDGLEWGADYVSNEDQADEIEFIYRDTVSTETIEYQIVERGNASNVLASGTATGNVTVQETVPPSESDTVWRVSFNATRTNGETLSGSRLVSSSDLPVGDFLPTEWQTAFSVVTLFVVAGLFGGVNPGVGGIAVASTGGIFWMIDWLPGSTTGLMVLLAFFVAVLSYGARQARGATA